MIPPLVSPIDLQVWLARDFTTDSEKLRADAVVQAVSALVRSQTGRTWVEGDALQGVPEDVRMVTLQVAARLWNNPDGYTAERLGDYSYTLPASAVTGMTLTAAERAILGRYRLRGAGLWSLSTTREDPVADEVYVPVVGAPPFPWYSAGGDW